MAGLKSSIGKRSKIPGDNWIAVGAGYITRIRLFFCIYDLLLIHHHLSTQETYTKVGSQGETYSYDEMNGGVG